MLSINYQAKKKYGNNRGGHRKEFFMLSRKTRVMYAVPIKCIPKRPKQDLAEKMQKQHVR